MGPPIRRTSVRTKKINDVTGNDVINPKKGAKHKLLNDDLEQQWLPLTPKTQKPTKGKKIKQILEESINVNRQVLLKQSKNEEKTANNNAVPIDNSQPEPGCSMDAELPGAQQLPASIAIDAEGLTLDVDASEHGEFTSESESDEGNTESEDEGLNERFDRSKFENSRDRSEWERNWNFEDEPDSASEVQFMRKEKRQSSVNINSEQDALNFIISKPYFESAFKQMIKEGIQEETKNLNSSRSGQDEEDKSNGNNVSEPEGSNRVDKLGVTSTPKQAN